MLRSPLPRSPLLRSPLIWQVPLGLLLLTAVALGAGGHPLLGCGAVALAATSGELVRRDVRERRLPNRMTLPAAAVGLAGGAAGALTGTPGWWVPFAAGAGFGGLLLVLAALGGLGMGDVKLALAIGLASPTLGVAVAAPLIGMLAGGVAGLVGLVSRGRAHRLPYGPFLLLGWVAAIGTSGLAPVLVR